MSATVTEARRGRDGKMHPLRPLPPAERQRAAALAHNLIHKSGLTVRAAQQVMLEQYDLCGRSAASLTT